MDGLIFIIMAIAFVVLDSRDTISDIKTEVDEVEYAQETRVTKLNEEFYDNPNAFSIIINALGYPKEM